MNNKHIHLTYFFWGLFFFVMVVFGLFTGKVIAVLDAEPKLFDFFFKETDPIFYYLTIFLYALMGYVLFYKSLLFISSNREDLIENEGFDRRVVGLEKVETKINFIRVLWVTFFSILIILFVYYIFLLL